MLSYGILEIGKIFLFLKTVFLIQLMLNLQPIKTGLILSTDSTEHALCMYTQRSLWVKVAN